MDADHKGEIISRVSDASLTDAKETMSHVELTPELLLERGGVDLQSAFKNISQVKAARGIPYTPQTVWPKLSEWFTAGIDGTGQFIDQRRGHHMATVSRAQGTYRQDLSGQIELESVVMRPKDVLESSFTRDVESVMDTLEMAKLDLSFRHRA